MVAATHVHRSSAARRAAVLAAALLLGLAPAPGGSGEAAQTTSAVTVTHAWLREAPPDQTWTAAYATLNNPTAGAVSLVAVEAPFARVVELHDMKVEGDTMRMARVPAIVIPPRTTITLKPGGLHIMIFGLAKPVLQGTRMPLVFRFSDGQAVVTADVRPRLATSP